MGGSEKEISMKRKNMAFKWWNSVNNFRQFDKISQLITDLQVFSVPDDSRMGDLHDLACDNALFFNLWARGEILNYPNGYSITK